MTKKISRNFHSALNKLHQTWFSKIITPVPPEYKDQFDQLQLKNSLRSIKILCLALIGVNIINWVFYLLIFPAQGKPQSIEYQRVIFKDVCEFAIIALFIISTACFSKKSARTALWCMCYLFVTLIYFLTAYYMIYMEYFEPLSAWQYFLVVAFGFLLIVDFKPRIFIPLLLLFYVAAEGILAYKGPGFGFRGRIFLGNNFIVVLITKILLYNSKVKTFVNIFKITQLNEKLEALSITDELTKLNNRRSFLNYYEIIWKQGSRLRFPLTVLMIDVDYFKRYNDSLRHLEGDKALVAIAQCIKNEVKRETDFVARFGGEEFVCLLPYNEKSDAEGFAKNLVQSVESMKITHPKSECSQYVTISVGMASIVPNEGYTKEQLLSEADEALYAAKQSGRNRVVTK